MFKRNFISVALSAHFLLYNNKRLTLIITTTIPFESPRLCVNHCLATSGCLAVNFLSSIGSCELTSGSTNTTNLIDDRGSDVYITGKYTYFRSLSNATNLVFYSPMLLYPYCNSISNEKWSSNPFNIESQCPKNDITPICKKYLKCCKTSSCNLRHFW